MAVSKQQIPYIASTIVLLLSGVLFFAFPIRNLFSFYLQDDKDIVLVSVPTVGAVYMALLYLFVVTTFFLTSFIDPGIYPREHTEEEDDFRHPLYQVIHVNGIQIKMKWCETCKFYRPPRCSHCSICDNCVENFDHHCPWVDNCVGKRNYKFFFLFVLSLCFFILNGFGWVILSIINFVSDREWTTIIVEFVLLFFGVLVFIPVVGLTGFHIGLVCMGRTTNEHVTGKYRGTHNPFDEGCFTNCTRVLCASKQPRYLNYRVLPYVPHHSSTRERLTAQQNIPVYEELDAQNLAHERSLHQSNNLQQNQRLVGPNGFGLSDIASDSYSEYPESQVPSHTERTEVAEIAV